MFSGPRETSGPPSLCPNARLQNGGFSNVDEQRGSRSLKKQVRSTLGADKRLILCGLPPEWTLGEQRTLGSQDGAGRKTTTATKKNKNKNKNCREPYPIHPGQLLDLHSTLGSTVCAVCRNGSVVSPILEAVS